MSLSKYLAYGVGFLFMVLHSNVYAQTDKQNEAQKKLLKEGKVYYEKYSCKSCHGDKGVLQGNLTKAFEKYNDEQMILYIRDPHKFNNYRMPVYELVIPEEAYKPLVAYIRWLGQGAARIK